jgi:hypothetical protein
MDSLLHIKQRRSISDSGLLMSDQYLGPVPEMLRLRGRQIKHDNGLATSDVRRDNETNNKT